MNSMLGSPDFARLVAQRTIQDRVDAAQARAVARQARQARHGDRRYDEPTGRPTRRHHLTWLAGALRPAH